jgi:phosphotransferase system enzyme I (PtsI)
LAVGTAFVYGDELQNNLEVQEIRREGVDEEYARVERAQSDVLKDLDDTASRVESELNDDHADIFRVQADILRTSSIMEEIKDELERELVNAAETVRVVLARLERHFGDSADPVFQQRAEDIADIARRLLLALAGAQRPKLTDLPKGSVVVAERLLPSDTVMLSRRSAVAAVVEHGGPLSHAALLTREMGIPAVGQIPDLLSLVTAGSRLLVDGSAGTVVVDPDDSQVQAFEQRVREHQRVIAQAHQRRHESARTQDGVEVHVWANISTREDAVLAADSGAEGVGLYRIESLYLTRKGPPTEDELLEGLRDTLTPIDDKPVTVRLLDVGGDKRPAFLNLPPDPNPSLGRRGVRLLRDFPDLLSTQLRALLRLSEEMNISISVPMITLLEEVHYVRRALQTNAEKLEIRVIPALGAMIETPSAALCAREIAAAADFMSLGTNDLTQYTMVAGREEDSVTDYYLEDHPAVQRLVAMVMEAAGTTTPVTLCGELAGRTDRRLTDLLQLGLTALSVAAPLVPTVKAAIRAARSRT